MWISGWVSRGPASSNATRTSGSSLRRAASTPGGAGAHDQIVIHTGGEHQSPQTSAAVATISSSFATSCS